MDILKARKKAQEAKEREAREAREAKAREERGAAEQRAPSSTGTGERDARAAKERDPELEAMRDRAIVGDVDEPPAPRGVEREAPIRIDPLQDFLAAYDDGDLAHVVDFGSNAPAVDDEKRFLSFELAGETYAASIMDIREILKFVSLTEVPRAPREVLGVLSKRGIVMPVVDLGAILGLRAPDRRADRDQRVLVAGDGERVCGLRVDRVKEVVRLAQRGIEDVPPSLGAKNAHMLVGLGRVAVEGADGVARTRMLILLDVPAVLAHFAEAMGVAPVGGAASPFGREAP